MCTVAKHAHKDIPVITFDHFFPKALYPFLALHPFNLVPACSTCNSTYKGEKDPLWDETNQSILTDALATTYHAYRDRAISILGKIRAQRLSLSQSALVIVIDDSLDGSRRRISTANRLYKLTSRWHKAVQSNKVYENLIYCLSCQPQENPQRSKSDLLKDLRIEKRRCRMGINSDDVIRIA